MRPGSDANARTPSNPRIACSVGNPGEVGEQRLVARIVHDELEVETLGIGEHERLLAALDAVHLRSETSLPEVERLLGPDPERDPVNHAVARSTGGRSRVLEERDVRPGAPLLVGVEQVVDRRVVLVDRLLDQPQSEDTGVELDVLRCVPRYGGDVVDSL